MSSSQKFATLVSTVWLRNQLQAPSTSIRLLAAPFFPNKNAEPAYLEKHINGAQFLDVHRCTRPTQYIPRSIPDLDCYTEYLRSLGISNGSHVVLYDHGSMRGAARAWWLFRLFGHERVSVLHGGMNKWTAEGLEITDKIPQAPPRGDISLRLQGGLLREYDDILDNIENKTEQLVDVRSEKDFKGHSQKVPGATVKALTMFGLPLPETVIQGHIPGSHNIHVDRVYEDDEETFKSPEQLQQLFDSEHVDLSRPITTMCYTGVTAAVMALAAAHAGKHNAAVYAGSWTEFCQRADQSQCVIDPDEDATSASSKDAG